MKRLLAVAALICCALFTAAANGALIKFGNLVLTAEGGFTPRSLPRHHYAPIDFKGHADLKAVDGGVPPALQQLTLDFDRDGRLSIAGLPSCDPSALQEATPDEARSRCRNAIVGTGHLGLLIARDDGPPLPTGSLLTLFNGPRLGGTRTVILHARTTAPAIQSFVITIPIEKQRGDYSYRATLAVPPIAEGRGAIVHADISVGKRYRYRGRERSYASARCSDGVLGTHGRFVFAEGLLIDGSVQQACTPR